MMMRKSMQAARPAALAGAALALTAGAAWAEGEYGPHGHYGMMGGGGWLFGPIMMVIFFALLVAAAVLILKLIGVDIGGRPGAAADDADKPMAILRERFARGEIDRDEFEERRKALGGS